MTRARWIYADILEVAAMIGVVLIHLTASVIDIRSEVGDIRFWWTAHVIDAAFRWSIPVLIMINGMLLLAPGRGESALTFYLKRFRSIVPLFVLWSMIYYVWDIRKEPSFDWGRFAEGFIKGTLHYHLGYVYMIGILYLIAPLLRVLVKRASLRVVFCIGAAGLIFSNLFPLAHWNWNTWGFVIDVPSLPGYIGYFLIGFVLSTAALNKGISWLLYGAGIMSYIAIVVGTNWLLSAHPSAKMYFYEDTSIPVFFTAAAVFVVVLRTTAADAKSPRLLSVIGSSVFHIYLSHVFIMEWLYEHRPWDIIHSSPLEYVPIAAVLIVLASLLIDRVWRGGLFALKASFKLAIRFRNEWDSIHPLKEIYQYREMLRNMVLKDLRTRYKGSALGFLWTFMNPLLMLGIYTAVFSFIMKADIPHFPMFILVALLPWNFFSQSITGGARSMINHAELMKKVYFPREVIPLSVIGSNLINYLLTLVILIPALWLSGIPLTVTLSGFPIILLAQTLIIFPIVMFAALATVYLRDLEHILNVLMMVGFYLTPVLFPVSLIPSSYRWLFEYNPMTTIIDAYREIFLYGQWPDFGVILPMLLVLVVVNAVALAVFALLQKHVVEEV
ncbi:acyltransferase family protein [Paenibacillus periandrae]|uniref:acyltransferase family protein n=1 Tax=Paenibacillus periandrae TaxID=1761741 RepID=UPI001F0947AA|nr:acyltransferase family protein [Paenibacillus periandrae]